MSRMFERAGLVPVVVLSSWTLFVWVGRLRNIAADDQLSGLDLVVRTGTALVFVALVGWIALGRGRDHRAVNSLVVVTIGVWVVRMATILAGGYSAGFVAVHLVLAAVSIGLASWVVLARGARLAPESKIMR